MKTSVLRLLSVLSILLPLTTADAAPTLKPRYNDTYTRLLGLEYGKENIAIGQPVFSIRLGNGRVLDSTDFKPAPSPNPNRHILREDNTGLVCGIELQPGKNGAYIRHLYSLKATRPTVVTDFNTCILPTKGFKPTGNVLGSPLASPHFFAAMEYPMAYAKRTKSALSTWSPKDLQNDGWTKLRIPLTPAMLTDDGKVTLRFTYTKGSQKLCIESLALVKGNTTVTQDSHPGETGDAHRDNTYTLDIPAEVKASPSSYTLVATVKGDENNDSHGTISLDSGTEGRWEQGLHLDRHMAAGDTLRYSTVYGAFDQQQHGSMRRAFLSYLESERARPWKFFLHYNSWYDICHSTPRYNLTSENCQRVMHQWHKKFTEPHGIHLDSYVFDDGWDDYDSLWDFRKSAFPNGFAEEARLAKKYGTHVGVWFSPFGGYGQAKSKRIATARRDGYEVNGAGLSLAGKNYYALFLAKTRTMMRDYAVNYFKFDGLGGSNPAYLPDMEAAYRLMQTLRDDNPAVYINLTTGTWASPFFLLHGDSTWRGGGDVLHRGTGSPTDRWLNYRDGETYHNIVTRGTLFPLNSLMIHGVVYANRGEGKSHIDDDDTHFAIQAWSSFASGSQLQEFYISEDRMNATKWETLAKAARWGLDHAATLQDVHWIGGDPYKEEIYGWASLSPDGKSGILCLRNPKENAQNTTFDLSKALETSPGTWQITKQVFASDPQIQTTVTAPGTLDLQLPPYSLIVLEVKK